MQKNILVVDDDPTIGDLIQEVLEQAGYGVQRAYSGTEAAPKRCWCWNTAARIWCCWILCCPGCPGKRCCPGWKGCR